eukprot:285975_1
MTTLIKFTTESTSGNTKKRRNHKTIKKRKTKKQHQNGRVNNLHIHEESTPLTTIANGHTTHDIDVESTPNDFEPEPNGQYIKLEQQFEESKYEEKQSEISHDLYLHPKALSIIKQNSEQPNENDDENNRNYTNALYTPTPLSKGPSKGSTTPSTSRFSLNNLSFPFKKTNTFSEEKHDDEMNLNALQSPRFGSRGSSIPSFVQKAGSYLKLDISRSKSTPNTPIDYDKMKEMASLNNLIDEKEFEMLQQSLETQFYHKNKLLSDVCDVYDNVHDEKLCLGKILAYELTYKRDKREQFYDILIHEYFNIEDFNVDNFVKILKVDVK